MDPGTAAIETIQMDDMVWDWDEETGEIVLKEFVNGDRPQPSPIIPSTCL